MARKIGAVHQSETGAVQIESLFNLSIAEWAQKIAEHYVAVSN